jgi:DNA-binding Xre family transcriptional regulator
MTLGKTNGFHDSQIATAVPATLIIRGHTMSVSYNKLWNLVRQNRMKKGELAKAAEISGYMMSKLNRDEPVQMEVMLRLCKVFHCDIGDLMEVIEE